MTLSKPAIAELHACLHECLDIVLDHAASLPAALMTKELIGFGHSTMHQQFIHVLFTEAAWICELQSLPLPKLDTAAETIDDLRHMKKNVTGATIAYLDSISEHALNSKLDHYPVSWVGPQRTPGFILLHIITHGFHHKGQIVAMLRLLGYPAPDTDMQRA